MSKKIVLAASAVAIAAAATAPRSFAALALKFSTTSARAGAVVTAATGGRGALSGIRPSAQALRIFLVLATDVDAVTAVADERLIPLGRLRVDSNGNGRLRFVVPSVAAGQYTTVAYCAPCAPYSAGRVLVPTGPFPGSFRITGATSTHRVAIAAAAFTLLAIATLIFLARRRRVAS